MKKALLFASALLLVMACNNFQTETYVDDIVVPLEEGQPDSLFLSINLEYVVTGMKVEARQLINSAIVANAFDLEDTGDPLEETAIRYRENLIDEYLNENAVLEEGVHRHVSPLSGIERLSNKFRRHRQLRGLPSRGRNRQSAIHRDQQNIV